MPLKISKTGLQVLCHCLSTSMGAVYVIIHRGKSFRNGSCWTSVMGQTKSHDEIKLNIDDETKIATVLHSTVKRHL